MKLTNDNYYNAEACFTYTSVSQLKSFIDCGARTMAEMRGEYVRPSSDAMMVGSYVDAHFSGEMNYFVDTHPELFNSRTGELKAAYRTADGLIARAERDEYFMSYLKGDTQTILTGEIEGIPIKGKLDVLQSDKIVDLKCMRSLEPVRKDGETVTFVTAYGYDMQAYVYQELVRQATGQKLPYYLAVITKEKAPDLAIIEIPQWVINSAGHVVRYHLPRLQAVKEGKAEPVRCGKCDYCKQTKILTAPMPYEQLLQGG